MRVALLVATVLLAALVLLALPVAERLARHFEPPAPPPLAVEQERRCGAALPVDPWLRSLGDVLEEWIVWVRTVATDRQVAAELAREASRLTTGTAEVTLLAYLELRAAQRLSPGLRPVRLEDVSSTFCLGPWPTWELSWTEIEADGQGGSQATRWLGVVRTEELPLSPEIHLEHPEGFLITDFDWGRVPGSAGAARTAPPTTAGDQRP